ncbi:signal recognition particle subunit Srp68p [[Candida] anglica]|uniref:Signal recognition particle subunit SRP68 n=1 Tax=[Candida] anglica TaxID=148631 RepID=A0ABP0E5B2_9ASCO
MDSPLIATYGARMSADLVSAEDFRRQRQRLNKQLRNLRHELNIVTRDTKNYSDKVPKVTSEILGKDEKYGYLLLLTAERDILYACEIKSLLELGTDGASSYKNLLVSKNKKALVHAKKVLESKYASDHSYKIESYVYAALIQGSLSITKKQWEVALHAFAVARCGLEYLNESESDSFKKTLFKDLLESIVDPSLNLVVSQSNSSVNGGFTDLKSIARKHCRDNELPYLGKLVDYINSIDGTFLSDISSERDLIRSIEWRGHEATLTNNEIAFKIMKLNETTDVDYDELAQGWSELVDIHRSERNIDEDDHQVVQERAILDTYLNYNALFAKLKRDIEFLSKDDGSRTSEMLLSNIIATVKVLKDLPGVYNDEELYQTLENLESFYVSKRIVYFAKLYSKIKKLPEALKLYNHVNESLKPENPYLVDLLYDVSTFEEYKTFRTTVQEELHQCHILTQIARDTEESSTCHQAIVENVNQYTGSKDSLKNIIGFEEGITISPVLSKPVLFDIGFNYINYDAGRSHYSSSPVVESAPGAATSTTDDSETRQRSGFFGMFGRS